MAPITSPQDWLGGGEEELTLPSGNTCLVQLPGMEELFSAGVLPDGLTKIALEQVTKAQGKAPSDHKKKEAAQGIDPELMKKFLEGENAIQEIFSSFDKIVEMCVVQPPVKNHMQKVREDDGTWALDEHGKVRWEKVPHSERDSAYLYTDRISMEDKSYIFNVAVGGSRDLEQFRDEFGDAVATVQPGKDVEVPTKRTPRRKK